MAPTKRTSSTGAERPSKVAKKQDMSACKDIAAALELAEKKDVPPSVISLLGDAIKHCLPTYKEDRHDFQNNILDMVAKTLEASDSALVADVAAAEATVNSGDEEKAKRSAAVAETEAAFTVAQGEHKAKQTIKTEKSEALKATMEPLKLAQAAQKSGDADAEALEKEKASLEAALTELLVPMKETGGNARQLSKLSKQLSAIELESSLLEAMQFALLQKPEKRGSFDAVIIENLETQAAAKKAAMEAKLQEAAPAREERAAAVKAAQDAHDAAKEANETAIAEQKGAKDAEAAAKAAAADAKDAANSLGLELEAAALELDAARKALEEFRSGPKAIYQELLDRTAPQPEPEEAPVAAEEVADTVPAASA